LDWIDQHEEEKETRGDAEDSDSEKVVDVLYPFLQQFGQQARLTYDQVPLLAVYCCSSLQL
jgi:hypothetical protein